MTEGPLRVDGWKAIAAYFRRDRSTVVRWANTGDLPVRRVPGKKGGSVWAYAHELDAWLAGSGRIASENTSQAQGRTASVAMSWAPVLGAAALLLAGVAAALLIHHTVPRAGDRRPTLPADAALARLYLQARDDWAARTPAGIARARAEFGEVISRDPRFAPAYAGVADTYIVARDFAAMPDAIAYPSAEAAAQLALAIDPDSAEANRALGFIDYWKRRDIRGARDHFARSFRAAPNDAQTHFWFGNILSNFGDRDASLQELGTARRLNPGSQAIEAAYALALWMRGPSDSGIAELQELAAQAPLLITPHIYLSWIYLVKGDARGYLDQRARLAALHRNPAFTARVTAERAAFDQGGTSGLLDLIANAPPVDDNIYSLQPEWPATAAAMRGRRDRLLALMARGEASDERWTTWRPDQVRFARWRGDPAVTAGLKRLHAFPAASG